MSAWIESSGLISADQPPFGLSPSSGADMIDAIFTEAGVGRHLGSLYRIVQKVAETPPSTSRICPVT